MKPDYADNSEKQVDRDVSIKDRFLQHQLSRRVDDDTGKKSPVNLEAGANISSKPSKSHRAPPSPPAPVQKQRSTGSTGTHSNMASIKGALTFICLAHNKYQAIREDIFNILEAASTLGINLHKVIFNNQETLVDPSIPNVVVVSQFVILLASSINLPFKGIYGYVSYMNNDMLNTMLVRLYGKGPRVLPTSNAQTERGGRNTPNIIENMFKYDFSSHNFVKIPECKSVIRTTDAISININKLK